MYAKRILLSSWVWLFSTICYSQTISYSYTDPCSGVIKSISVPGNGITVTYYGQIKTFNQNDFLNGTFNSWTNSVLSSYGNNSPCGSVVGVPTAINIAQNNTISFVSLINSITAVSDMAGGSTDVLGGTLGAADAGSSSGSDNSSNSEKKDNSGSGGNGSGGSGSGGSGSTTDNSSNTSSSGGGSINVVGNSVNSTSAASGSGGGGNSNGSAKEQSKNGNRPNVVASSDFVGFNFKNSDVSYGGKFSGSYVSSKWDGSTSHGFMGDYTTATKGPNLSVFYAWNRKNRVDLISTQLSLGFDTKFTAYGTLSVGQMWKFKKRFKKLKVVYLATGSWGSVYEQNFIATALIAGGMYDLKASKRIEMKIMGLYIYAPYVRYYNDILLKSPNVILPIIGTNIGITKRFKFNINIGGAYAISQNALNYTIMMGTKLAL